MRKQILNEGCIWRLGVSATMDEDEYSLHGLRDDEEQLAGVAVGTFLCIWLASDQRHFFWLVWDTTYSFLAETQHLRSI
jgi:hypothetical protein